MGLTFLVVDDSRIVRAVVAKALTLCQMPIDQILESADGQLALDVLNQQHVDMVFTDINMPNLDGIGLVREMKKNTKLSAIPVVVISTEGSEPRIAALKADGISDFLRKPFTPEQIRGLIQKHLGGSHAAIAP